MSGIDAEQWWHVEAERWRVEAERWRVEAEGLASRNVVLEAENTALRAGLAEVQAQAAALKAKVATLAKQLYAASSEKKKPAAGKDPDPDPGRVRGAGSGPGSGDPDADGPGGEPEPRRRRGQRKGSRGHGRRDYSGLPTEEQVHDLPPEQRVCPRCGAGYAPWGEECCDQVDWRVHLVRVRHRRRRYRRTCRCPVPGIVAAPVPPKPIRKGLFTAMFLARLLVDKYVLGRPLGRVGAALAHDGLHVAQGSLVGALGNVSELLAPLEQAIRTRNAAAGHLHIDETRWNVFQAVTGKDSHRWWLWVFVAPDTTVFRIERSRSLAALNAHLGLDLNEDNTLPQGRQLLLSSDFYAVYQSLGAIDGVDNLWCWAHIRRYFIRAGHAHPHQLRLWAEAWVARIGALYAARTAMTASQPGSDAHALAAAQFRTALHAIDAERKDQAARPGLHPAAAKVLATLNREWDGLTRHEQYPDLPLDNNSAERALRTPVVGRKNFYGSASVSSAELAGRAWTITATAAQAGLNPLTYLADFEVST
jgi:transposase